jgi:hypothetical protein
MDEKTLMEKLDCFNAIIIQIGDRITFISPREIPEDLKADIRGFLKHPVKFILEMKPHTTALMVEIFRASGTPVSAENFLIEDRKLTIFLKSEEVQATVETVVNALKNCVENDGFIETLVFNIDGIDQVINFGISKLILETGRSEYISEADIMDLRILLETSKSWDDFLNSI